MQMRSLEELRVGLRSVVGITVTPFDAEGSIDQTAYSDIVRRCVVGGVSVLTPNGNTSEFYSLTPQERRTAAKLTREAAPDAIIVAGIGGDIGTAIEEARYLQSIGVDCIMVHEPVHPFWSNEGWVDYHRQLARAVPGYGLVPYIRNPKVGTDAIARLLDEVPEVIGVKYAISDPVSFAQVAALAPPNRVTWICGLAEMWAPFFADAGAMGFTSGLVSVDAARSMRMFHALKSGDTATAMREQREVTKFENLRARNASEFNVTTVKEALAQMGLCRRDVRPPLSLLDAADRRVVSEILNDWQLESPLAAAQETSLGSVA